MNRLIVAFILWIAVITTGNAHVVTQLYAEWLPRDGSWTMEVQFEAGFSDPVIRGNPSAPAPDRDWLLAQGKPGWEKLKLEADRYVRESLSIRSDGNDVRWRVIFTDFATDPPDFPKLLTNGAYLRMLIVPEVKPDGPLAIHWADGENRPSFILKVPGANGGYLTFAPGDSKEIKTESTSPQSSLWTAFRQGFLHVLPLGWDHVLFVLGLFFYQRKWKPLLHQSLAFTAAHTVTLGLAASGVIHPPGSWVEPLIAFSLAAVALENFRASRDKNELPRLAVVFAFGLIHGLGFAGALSAWLKPGEGFLPALLSANLGVEVAQAVILAAAWIVTIGWHETKAYRIFRIIVCIGIAAIGLIWTIQRLG